MITVLFFAGLEEKAGVSKVEVDFSGKTIKDLKSWAESTYNLGEGTLEHMLTAVNEEFAYDRDQIHPNDTVAFIPPVSGG
ncbi:molybdopterin converting factor subunit 1 [Shouchella patagoniensis]|uniref:molybdopterin converting factor subunit 1 n=1 Tax=Shouchella patagoniensis TaxID=228576 RepID=UPI0009958A7A|nr:molybdopterin converting factor subunit 1 [Shouchella patagoniensis]